MSQKFSNRLKLLLALSLFLSTAVSAMSTYKIRIDDHLIHASKNGDVVEIRTQDNNLVVSLVPKDGFYGMKVGDRIVSIDGAPIHKTGEFVDALERAHGNDAKVALIRENSQVDIDLPRQGYSWFL